MSSGRWGDAGVAGQARKSLWIETSSGPHCCISSTVRLVRACGSKLYFRSSSVIRFHGQARKSLWIETIHRRAGSIKMWVRLVRACGSKHPYHTHYKGDWWVRLVRACGSKPGYQKQPEQTLAVRLVRACGSKHYSNQLLLLYKWSGS